ncbi:glycosyltransferase family 4 protein [Agilicoccus flavus]|uniref:glycosyltransferase family 4 protein n=1 Tax=Agilicoccus flavus TaxID=2775968 RepID=UPI001CF6E339|nr:glycosyltransferase family 4 protein [Agilicoccus flavus]
MAGLRVALLSYRSKPHSGGQGIYVRHLSRALSQAGHDVTVVSGPPYPELDVVGSAGDELASDTEYAGDAGHRAPNPRLVRLPSLDLYREPDPFRIPALREFRDAIDVLEFAGMCTAGFPEPLTFSLRAARWLSKHRDEFDVVHDNQGLGYGMLAVPRLGLPLVTTIHHPITRDRVTDLASASGWRRLTLGRWYGFLAMQGRVARAQRHVVTVSESSERDIVADFRVDPRAVHVVPLGVQTDVFAPGAARVPGRVVAMASADTPIKGVDTLLHAVAHLRTRRRGLEVVVITRPTPGGPTARLVDDLGLRDTVRFVDGLTGAQVADLFASAQVVCVPSRYEGFSLPTVEAMACGTPLVVSRAGALPEVVGPEGECALLVPPGDAAGFADALDALLGDDARRAAMGEAGRRRAVETYDWSAVARGTARVYRAAIGAPEPPEPTARPVPGEEPARADR